MDGLAVRPCGTMENLCTELLLLPSVSSMDAAMESARAGTLRQAVQDVIEGTEVSQSSAAGENSPLLTEESAADQGPSLGETCRESFAETLGEVIASISVTPGSPAGVLVNEGGQYLCQKCGESFPYSSLLSPHQCSLFTQSDSLDFHDASHLSLTGDLVAMPVSSQDTKGHQTSLSFCLAKAQSSTENSRQEMISYPVDDEKAMCPICSKEFTLLTQLKGHFKCHAQPQPVFACSDGDCLYATEERKLFHTHLKHVHKVTPVPCARHACQLLFQSAEDMLQHHRIHFPFHCRHCRIVSSNVKLFGQHRKTHMEQAEDPISISASNLGLKELCRCSKCDFTTVSMKVLTQHLRLHSDWDVSQEELNSQEDGDQEEDSASSASDLPHQHGRKSVGDRDSESTETSSTSSSEEEEAEEHMEITRDVEGDKKAMPTKATLPRAARVRQFKGDVEEGTEYLFKTHMCPECKRCFKKRTHLVEHLHLHFPDPSLQCPNCQRFFTSRSKLKIHMMREQGEKSHHCPICDYRAVERNALNRHMSSMHEDSSNFYSDTYSCPACKETFSLSQALKEHMKTHKAEPQLLVCFQEDCGRATADRKEFLFHLKDAHGIKPVECRHHACSLLFRTREEMEAHQLSHYAFHCEQCSFFCSNKLAFRKHKRQGHPGSEELACRFCPFKTFNPVEFRDHVGKMHANEKIHSCDECDFATAHKRVLTRHKMLHTGEKPYKCQCCEFTCRDVSYLSKHMLTHSSDKNYMCTECGYVTKWKHYLSVHMRKHTGDLRYHCNQCSYRCHRADQLSSHKLRHQGKSLICEVCGFACKRKYELQKHRQARHSQNYQMPVYHCQYCRYQSNYKQALRNHENCKHTKQKEFRCALCTYRTFSNTSLFCHKRKVHGYVPGDKNWLENYASKEMEICSADELLNYDLVATRKLESNFPPPGRDLWQRAKAAAIETQNDYPQINGAPCPGSEQPQQIVEAVRSLEGDEPNNSTEGEPTDFFAPMSSMSTPDLPDLALDSVVNCSLQLESIGTQGDPSTSAEQLSKDTPAMQLEELETLNCEEPATLCPDLDTGETLVLEENHPMEGLHYSDVSNDPRAEECSDLQKVVGYSTEDLGIDAQEETMESAMQNLTEEQHSAHKMSSSEADLGAGDEQITIDIQETLATVLKPGELLTIDMRVCDSNALVQDHQSIAEDLAAVPEETEASRSESALKALKRQDKEQAETLMLEGRVQMLVLQSESQVFKCEKCSYITRKERAMSLHSEAGCGTRKSLLLCKECGASFQQQRGLNTHIMKKCPVIQKRRKVRPAFYVEHGRCPTTRQGVLQLENTPSDDACTSMACPSSSQNIVETVCDENGVEGLQEAASADLCISQEVGGDDFSCEQLAEALFRDAQPDHNGVTGDECPSPSPRTQVPSPPPSIEKYTFQQGKFHCRHCSFVCSRFSTITCHVEEGCKQLQQFPCLLCAESFHSKKALKAHQAEKHVKLESEESALEEGSSMESFKKDGSSDEGEDGDTGNDGKASQDDDGSETPELRGKTHSKKDSLKGRCLSCPACPFTCHQERAMETHKKKGCLKSGQFQCALCSFNCKSATDLKHHKQLHKRFYSKRPQLRCRQCDFTCKQPRCLKQHIRIQHEGVKPHKCSYCNFSTTRRYRLEAHKSLHTGLGRVSCSVCSQTFGTNSKLRIHTLRVHEKKPTHFCSLCDYGSYNQNDITRHTNSCHNGELRFACKQCEARFSSETALKQHTLRRHEEKICLHCQHCLFVCHSDTTLKCHMQRQHPHLECGTCKEMFDSRDELEDHKKSHFSHRCECCDFAAKERPQLVHHYLEVHEPGAEQGLRCPFCAFACQYKLVFDHHMKGHGGTRAYKCSDCDYTTKNKQKITWHSRIHTGEKPYKCHLCVYACADPSRLKYHMRIHKEERKYLCPDCGYKCKWVNQLKYHMTKHTGYKPYACDECEYCSNRADALRIHKETRHRDARAFICEQCGKAFKTRFLLKTHQKKHSEDKPYVCNVCHRGFRWAAGLRHHYLTHTNEYPFFCRYCSYTAKQKFQVIKHIRRHHPESTATDPKEGVGKNPSTPTVHLHDVQLESVEEIAPQAPAEAVG